MKPHEGKMGRVKEYVRIPTQRTHLQVDNRNRVARRRPECNRLETDWWPHSRA